MNTEQKNYVNVQWLRRRDEIERLGKLPDRLPNFFGTKLAKSSGTEVHPNEIFWTSEITSHPTNNARNKVSVLFANILNGQGLEEETLTTDQLLLRFRSPGLNSFPFPENLATITRRQTEKIERTALGTTPYWDQPQHWGGAKQLQLSQDGERLASAGHDCIFIWDIRTCARQNVLIEHLPPSKSASNTRYEPCHTSATLQNLQIMQFANQNKLLAGGGDQGWIWVWDLQNTLSITNTSEGCLLPCFTITSNHRATIGAMSFSSDNTLLATVGRVARDHARHKIEIWDIRQGCLAQVISIPPNPFDIDVPYRPVSIRWYDANGLEGITIQTEESPHNLSWIRCLDAQDRQKWYRFDRTLNPRCAKPRSHKSSRNR
jgi:WD40 repeat protein